MLGQRRKRWANINHHCSNVSCLLGTSIEVLLRPTLVGVDNIHVLDIDMLLILIHNSHEHSHKHIILCLSHDNFSHPESLVSSTLRHC